MSKDDFSPEEFATRHRRVREQMEREGLDLLLVIHPTNIQYLIGSRTKSYQEFQVLFFTLEDAPLTIITRLAEVTEFTRESLAEDIVGWGGREPEDPIDAFHWAMKSKNFMNRRVGIEVPDFYLHPYHYQRIKDILDENLVMDASMLIHDLKLAKSPAELAYIRQAVKIADATMQRVVDAIFEGATECEVAGEAYRSLVGMGGDLPASPINFSSGERTCYGHGMPTTRRIQRGDFMMIEFGAAVCRYGTTIGRHFCLGEPTKRMRELDAIVRAACDACIAEVHPGAPAVKPHLAAKKVIEDAGLDAYRLHTTGYGIAPGYPPSWCEYIHFFGDSTYTLKSGMVLSVEPPVLIAEENLGARIIDNVLVTETGAEVLSTFPRDIVVID